MGKKVYNKVFERRIKKYEQFDNKITLTKYDPPMFNRNIDECLNDQERGQYKEKDKSDRATIEQVISPRTRLILCRFIQKNILSSIDGCVSTGKEANVFHALKDDGSSWALKIYKTQVVVFKDRSKYVIGDYRFGKGYRTGNKEKMVIRWAEKEFKNLKRLQRAKIRSPVPSNLNGQVLVMQFMGNGGWPFKLLKNANIFDINQTYRDCVRMMYQMYNVAKLVHADLSEYNMLYDNINNELIFIDVSQSVEHDHPNAFCFLRKDVRNISLFFHKHEGTIMSCEKLFNFIINKGNFVNDDYKSRVERNEHFKICGTYMHVLDDELETILSNLIDDSENEDLGIDDDCFIEGYIPMFANDLQNVCDEDSDKFLQNAQFLNYKHINLQDDNSRDDSDDKSSLESKDLSLDVDVESISNCSKNYSDQEDDQETLDKLKLLRKRGESLEDKKNRKAAARADKKSRLENKTPKYIKSKRNRSFTTLIEPFKGLVEGNQQFSSNKGNKPGGGPKFGEIGRGGSAGGGLSGAPMAGG